MMNSSLLPNNATLAELAMEAVLSHVGDLPGDIRIIKNPNTCPLNLLPWLAWENAVTYWNTDWSESQKRSVLREAARTNKKRGTLSAVERALLSVGFESSIHQWFETTPKGAPYTFGIKILLLRDMGMDENLLDTFIAQIFDAKNCRSFLNDINLNINIDGAFYIGAATATHIDVSIGTAIKTVANYNAFGFGSLRGNFNKGNFYDYK